MGCVKKHPNPHVSLSTIVSTICFYHHQFGSRKIFPHINKTIECTQPDDYKSYTLSCNFIQVPLFSFSTYTAMKPTP